MDQLSRNETPPVFDNYFLKLEQSHSYDTTQQERNTYVLPRINELIAHNQLAIRGCNLWPTLDESLKYATMSPFKKKPKKEYKNDY